MKIELTLDVEVSYDRIPQEIGDKDENGNVELIPNSISLTSIKCKGIELISLLSPEEILALEQEIEEKES